MAMTYRDIVRELSFLSEDELDRPAIVYDPSSEESFEILDVDTVEDEEEGDEVHALILDV